MAEPREIRVKLTADVDAYVAAMDRATEATERLNTARKGGKVARWLIGIAVLILLTR